jgi:hypothetical protein
MRLERDNFWTTDDTDDIDMDFIADALHPKVRVRLNLLATKDAHGLYEQYGFTRKECMILRNDMIQKPDSPERE